MSSRLSPESADAAVIGCGDSLYETDFYAWTREQSKILRAGRLSDADLPNIIEEIETLGRSEASTLRSAYRLILLHLLKIAFQPDEQAGSWRATIGRERGQVEETLSENPGLRPRRIELFERAYVAARREAAAETTLSIKRFPAQPPFTLEQIEDHGFWPAADQS